MQRREDEKQKTMLLHELEKVTGQKFSEDFVAKFGRGADEIDLVRSGLDDTMRGAYQSMREVWHAVDGIEDMRTAAYYVSLRDIASSYRSLGL
jgi:glutamate dehydrogenase (NAD(P)+)